MTTGVTIYLVSACASGEDFVSAFRRYADRNGVVFVPIAEPLPPGKKGRFALALKDGGVMVEGEAEVVSSAKTPSVLYGRVGMTLKFTDPDEPSKTILGELEKARLAMKPAPPSVAPRPADLPAQPRSTPPPASGRIDAMNALAESVVIGDLSALSGDESPPKLGQKFVVPSIPPVAGGRPRTTTVTPPPLKVTPPPAPRQPTPPSAVPIAARPATPPTAIPPPLDKAPAPPPPVVSAKATVMGMPPLEKAPAGIVATTENRDDPTMPTPASAFAAAAGSRDKHELQLDQTMKGPAPKLPPSPAPKHATPAAATPTVPRQPTPPSPAPVASPPALADESDDVDEPTDLTEIPIEPSEKTGREPRKTVMGIAVVPFGVHVLPAAPARRIASEDELSDTGMMDVQDGTSGPVLITSTRPPEQVDVLGATQPSGAKLPSAVMNATVEEATPSGDWTMTPGENGPTIAPRQPPGATPEIEVADPEEDAPIKQIPAGPKTGDWMIALDPSQPDGWSEPSKIEKRPEGELPPEPGPPKSMVSSAKDLDSNAKVAPEPEAAAEPKVQIDPTLIEPLQPLQPIDDFDDEPQAPMPSAPQPMMAAMEMAGAPHRPTPVPPGMQGPIPGSYLTPVPQPMPLANSSGQVQALPMDPAQLQMGQPRGVTDGGSGFFRETNEVPRYASDSSPAIESDAAARKRRMIVIGASAGGALLLVIVLAIVLGGGKKPSADEPKGSDGSAATDHAITTPTPPPPLKQGSDTPPPPKAGSDQQVAVAPPPDAAEAPVVTPDAPEAPPEVAASTDCVVEFSTAPQGAEIVQDKNVLGTTPAKLTLPCGVESRLAFRKQRFVTAQRAVTPKVKGQKPVRVALAKVTFTVKVSSSPPGATILLGSKSLGITPAAIKLPAFEASTLKITKDGYAADVQKITPKTNNLSISSSLKKLVRKAR